jgi:hypothetical protein
MRLNEEQQWLLFCDGWLDIEKDLAERLWISMARCEAGRPFVFGWRKVARSPDLVTSSFELLCRWTPPYRIIPIFEKLHENGFLTRNDSNTAIESVLKRTGQTGQWKD